MPSNKMRLGVAWKEVLIIVAVVFALMVLLGFPLPNHKNARRAACISNMKQLALASIQYVQDNDSAFPPGRTLGGEGWAGQLYPYVKSTGIYVCPEDRQSSPGISYAENSRLVRQKMTALTSPAQTVIFYEASTKDCDPSNLAAPENVSATSLSAPQDSTRHDSSTFGLDFAAADGHARWLTPGKVSSGVNAVSPKQAERRRYSMTFAIK